MNFQDLSNKNYKKPLQRHGYKLLSIPSANHPPNKRGQWLFPLASRTRAGALGESGAAAVLEHKFHTESQAFTRVDVTDVGCHTFSQSTCPCTAHGLALSHGFRHYRTVL